MRASTVLALWPVRQQALVEQSDRRLAYGLKTFLGIIMGRGMGVVSKHLRFVPGLFMREVGEALFGWGTPEVPNILFGNIVGSNTGRLWNVFP